MENSLTFDEFLTRHFPDDVTKQSFTVDRKWLEHFYWLATPLPKNSGLPGKIETKNMHFVQKDWGHELWITNNEMYCGKLLFLRAGANCSYHFHKIKDEVLYIANETGLIRMIYEDNPECLPGIVLIDSIGPHVIEMKYQEAFHVKPYMKHQMHALSDTYIFEFSTQHFDEDSHRITRELYVP